MMSTKSNKTATTQPKQDAEKIAAFWDARKQTVYHHVLSGLLSRIAGKTASIVDIGSGGAPYLEWFPNSKRRISVDMRKPYEAEGVESVKSDFLVWNPKRNIKTVMSLLTLEKTKRPDLFARKLLATGDTIVVSVAYKLTGEKAKAHVNENIDEDQMREWFGREPSFSYICREYVTGFDKLIQVYEHDIEPWSNLNERSALRAALKNKKS